MNAFSVYVFVIAEKATVMSPELVCPAKSVPVGVRQTGMEGAWNGQGTEIQSGADREPTAAD
jgi:hypothetical protein